MTSEDTKHAFETANAWADEIAKWFVDSINWRDLPRSERNEMDDPDDTKPEPLSVLVRSDWHVPGTENVPMQYELLLATGGPAVRLIGELNQYGEPQTVTLECQDWFTKWIEVRCTDETDEALLAYAATFYFGE
jgi:hypothetical protein